MDPLTEQTIHYPKPISSIPPLEGYIVGISCEKTLGKIIWERVYS